MPCCDGVCASTLVSDTKWVIVRNLAWTESDRHKNKSFSRHRDFAMYGGDRAMLELAANGVWARSIGPHNQITFPISADRYLGSGDAFPQSKRPRDDMNPSREHPWNSFCPPSILSSRWSNFITWSDARLARFPRHNRAGDVLHHLAEIVRHTLEAV